MVQSRCLRMRSIVGGCPFRRRLGLEEIVNSQGHKLVQRGRPLGIKGRIHGWEGAKFIGSWRNMHRKIRVPSAGDVGDPEYFALSVQLNRTPSSMNTESARFLGFLSMAFVRRASISTVFTFAASPPVLKVFTRAWNSSIDGLNEAQCNHAQALILVKSLPLAHEIICSSDCTVVFTGQVALVWSLSLTRVKGAVPSPETIVQD